MAEPAAPAGPGVRFVRPPELFAGAPYAYASVVRSPGLVLTAGACPLDAAGLVVAPGDLGGQVRQAVANLLLTLAAAGSGADRIVQTRLYVVAADRAELVSAWTAYRDALGDHDPPSTLLGVGQLGYADQLVELEAVAIAG